MATYPPPDITVDRIGELVKLGITISQASVAKYMVRHWETAVTDMENIPHQPCVPACPRGRQEKFLRLITTPPIPSLARAAREAGYSESVARKPKIICESPSVLDAWNRWWNTAFKN